MEYSIDFKRAKLWSRMGSRATLGQALLALSHSEENLIVFSADLSRSSGLGPMINKFPHKFVNAGIAEQNMIGAAAGFSKIGYNVFVTSFVPFLAYRSSEMIRMNLSYMKFPIKIIGLASGVALNFLGNSHFGLEDITIFKTFPEIIILSPSDCVEIFKVIEAASKLNSPVYIRLTGGTNFPIINTEDYNFEVGKFITTHFTGNDVHIYATGSMVFHSIEAAKLLENQGIKCKVLNVHTIQPFDSDGFKKNLLDNKSLIVTVEEHFIDGGLGSTVIETMHKLNSKKNLLKIGLPMSYLETGDYNFMLDKYNLTGEKISYQIINKLKIINNE